MGEWLKKAWGGWLSWVVIGLLAVVYLALRFVEFEADEAEARSARVGREVRAKVGADLRTKSAARHEALMKKIKSGALFEAPASTAAPSDAPATD